MYGNSFTQNNKKIRNNLITRKSIQEIFFFKKLQINKHLSNN